MKQQNPKAPDNEISARFGPTRGELIFRLCFSLAGLVFMGIAFAYRGIVTIAAFEIIAIAGVFFGGTAIWSGRALWRHQTQKR